MFIVVVGVDATFGCCWWWWWWVVVVVASGGDDGTIAGQYLIMATYRPGDSIPCLRRQLTAVAIHQN